MLIIQGNLHINEDKIIIDGIVETYPVLYRFKKIDKMQFNINTGSNIFKVVIFSFLRCINQNFTDKSK